MGYAETQQHYKCLYFEASKNHIRFAAGTGSRFAVNDFDGKKIVRVRGTVSILFSSSNIKNLIAILSKAKTEEVVIKELSAYGDNKPKIVILYDNTTLVLEGMVKSTKYPCMDKMLDYEYPCQVETKVDDWRPVIKGIEATKTDKFKKENDVHPVTVTAHLDSDYFEVYCQTDVGSHGAVEFTSKTVVGDPSDDTDNELWFNCASAYLAEMLKKAGKAKSMVIGFEGYKKDSKGEWQKPRPVLIKYPKVIKNGIAERFYMFFAVSTDVPEDEKCQHE